MSIQNNHKTIALTPEQLSGIKGKYSSEINVNENASITNNVEQAVVETPIAQNAPVTEQTVAPEPVVQEAPAVDNAFGSAQTESPVVEQPQNNGSASELINNVNNSIGQVLSAVQSSDSISKQELEKLGKYISEAIINLCAAENIIDALLVPTDKKDMTSRVVSENAKEVNTFDTSNEPVVSENTPGVMDFGGNSEGGNIFDNPSMTM